MSDNYSPLHDGGNNGTGYYNNSSGTAGVSLTDLGGPVSHHTIHPSPSQQQPFLTGPQSDYAIPMADNVLSANRMDALTPEDIEVLHDAELESPPPVRIKETGKVVYPYAGLTSGWVLTRMQQAMVTCVIPIVLKTALLITAMITIGTAPFNQETFMWIWLSELCTNAASVLYVEMRPLIESCSIYPKNIAWPNTKKRKYASLTGKSKDLTSVICWVMYLTLHAVLYFVFMIAYWSTANSSIFHDISSDDDMSDAMARAATFRNCLIAYAFFKVALLAWAAFKVWWAVNHYKHAIYNEGDTFSCSYGISAWGEGNYIADPAALKCLQYKIASIGVFTPPPTHYNGPCAGYGRSIYEENDPLYQKDKISGPPPEH